MGWVSQVTASSPIAWFRHDETSGTDVIDSSGSGYIGVYRNGVTLGASSPVDGTAISLDSAGLQYLKINGWNGIGGNSLSFACWFKSSDTRAEEKVIAAWGDPNITGGRFYLSMLGTSVSDGAIGCGFVGGSRYSSGGFNDGAWHFLVVVVGATIGDTAIYVDGVRADVAGTGTASTPVEVRNTTGGSVEVSIGAAYSSGAWGRPFDGEIDESVFWTRRLSATEIADLYASASTIAASALPMALAGIPVIPAVSMPLRLAGLIAIPMSLAGRREYVAAYLPTDLTGRLEYAAASIPTRMQGYVSIGSGPAYVYIDEVLADAPLFAWRFQEAASALEAHDETPNDFPGRYTTSASFVGLPAGAYQQSSIVGDAGDYAIDLSVGLYGAVINTAPPAMSAATAATLEWVGEIPSGEASSQLFVFQPKGGQLFAGFGPRGIALATNAAGLVEARCGYGSGSIATVTHPADLRGAGPVVLHAVATGAELILSVNGIESGRTPAPGLLMTGDAAATGPNPAAIYVGAGHNIGLGGYAPNLGWSKAKVCEVQAYSFALSPARVAVHAAAAMDGAAGMAMRLTGFIAFAATSLEMRLVSITAVAASDMTMRLESAAPGHYNATAARWSVQVMLGGADISHQITGTVAIEHREDASGLADFELIPAAGPINPDDFERKKVVIRFEGRDASGALLYSVTRYTGIATRADYDPDRGIITVQATTDLQGRLENLDRAAIARLVGGKWSEHVFDDTADGWQYAQDRISTREAEMHVNNYGQIVVVPWAAGAPVSTFTDSNRFAGTMELQRVSRRDLVTRVEISL